MWSGYWLTFSLSKRLSPQFCKPLTLGIPKLPLEEQNKKFQSLSVLGNFFFKRYIKKGIRSVQQISGSTINKKQVKATATFQLFENIKIPWSPFYLQITENFTKHWWRRFFWWRANIRLYLERHTRLTASAITANCHIPETKSKSGKIIHIWL